MPVSVTMPRLGESVSEGTVTRWLKQEGERVEADEPLLEVSTDKVDTEIPSPASGVIKSIKVSEDETVEVGAELAVIDEGSGGGEAAQEQDAKQEAEPEAEPEPEAKQEAEPEPEAKQEAEPEPEPVQEPEPAREEPARASAPAEQRREQPAEQPTQQPTQQEQEPERQPSGGADGDAAYVTPLVRRLAAEHGVDLASVRGTGVGGRIRKQDVLDAAGGAAARADGQREAAPAETREAGREEQRREPREAPPARQPSTSPAQVRGRTEKLSRLRTVIARRMLESLQVSAQLTTVVEADITKIARVRDRAKRDFEAREGVKLSFLPFFALAAVEALRQHPAVNSSIDLEAGTVTYHDAVHLGMAVDTERGLLVPVIHDAQDLNIAGLARKIADLAQRTRTNAITPDELGGGTFTLTNTGSRGALFDTPIINQPQVGILGTGAVVRRPAVVDDPDLGEVVAVRSIVYLALTYDHRIVDGADAARFLGTVKQRLEDGAFDAELGV